MKCAGFLARGLALAFLVTLCVALPHSGASAQTFCGLLAPGQTCGNPVGGASKGVPQPVPGIVGTPGTFNTTYKTGGLSAGSGGGFTAANSAIFGTDSAGNELWRLWASGPNGGSTTGVCSGVVGDVFGSLNLYFGLQSGLSQASDNTSAAYFNTGLGHQTFMHITTGCDNVAVGLSSLEFNTTGNFNVAGGVGSSEQNTTGSNNTAWGHHALILGTTASNNTGVGDSALANNVTAGNNVAIGYTALFNYTGNAGTGVSTAVGYQAGSASTTGTANTFIGANSGSNVTTAGGDTIVGQACPGTNTNNEIEICDGSGDVWFKAEGNSSGQTFLPGVPSCSSGIKSDASGTLSCVVSSLRFKKPAGKITAKEALDFVAAADPAVFTYVDQARDGKGEKYGLYAEEVCKLSARLCQYDKEGRVNSYDDRGVLALLIRAEQASTWERIEWRLGLL